MISFVHKGRKLDRTKLEPESPYFRLKTLALELCRACFCSFHRGLREGNLDCMFVCFSFYLTLFIFIGNTKRLPQNSLKMKSWIVCGENNVACTSELKFLG